MEVFRIEPRFQNLLPPMDEEQFKQLRKNIIKDGKVIEPLVVWNGILVDGHNRYKVIEEFPDIPYTIEYKEFPGGELEVMDWMCSNQKGRRNMTPLQIADLQGKQNEIRMKMDWAKNQTRDEDGRWSKNQNNGSERTSETLAKEWGVARSTFMENVAVHKGLDAVRNIVPEAADAFLSGEAKVTKEQVKQFRNMEPEAIKEKAEEILNDSEKPKPKKPAQDGTVRKNFGNSAEGRALKETIKQAYAPLVDASLGVAYNLDDLIEELTIIGDTCARHLHQAIEIRRSIIPEEAKVTVQNVIRSIARKIDQEVHQV